MRRALELAVKGRGRTSPNPMVGAVIVKGGRIVGEGFHRRAGSAHAEINALRRAGSRARGADLYVTLEPCCHEGRTPPCVDAISAAGVKRVFVGTRDPNPLVNGRGMRALRASGVEVKIGLLGSECRVLGRAYEKFVTAGRPFVTAKAAVTLDGKIAAAGGESRWISNAKARRYVHELRRSSDAVMVGVGTALADDPSLTVRLPGRSEQRTTAIVVDSLLRVPDGLKLMKRGPGELIVLTTTAAPAQRAKALKGMGHEVIAVDPTEDGRVDMAKALAALGELGICSVLVEGGGQLMSDLVSKRLIDRIAVCVAPKFLGGGGADLFPDLSVEGMDAAVELKDVSLKLFGDNVIVEGMLA